MLMRIGTPSFSFFFDFLLLRIFGTQPFRSFGIGILRVGFWRRIWVWTVGEGLRFGFGFGFVKGLKLR